MAVMSVPRRYVVNDREYELLRTYAARVTSRRDATEVEPKTTLTTANSHKTEAGIASSFRSATRVFVATLGSLEAASWVLHRLAAARTQSSTTASRKRQPIVASPVRTALSVSSILFLHSVLFRILSRLRVELLREQVRGIRERYPKIYAALTSRVAPAVGASLSGLCLGICPADQLRVTVAIYVACRALEVGYAAIEQTDLIRNKKPKWMGSWLLFALAQGQLLHAFVFDRDCFPAAYGSFILGYTPEYVPRRPANLSPRVAWPRPDDVVDALGQMARLRWPVFVSPILQPGNPKPLPDGIDPVISAVTSRAHPAIQKLSCALIHPSDPSCFLAYVRQNLLAFPQLARFYAVYYGALSLLRIKKLAKTPVASLNRFAESVLRSTVAICGSIGAAWGSICLFQALLPRAVLPKFRFFLGGFLGGLFQLVDRNTPAGHATSLYAARTSVDSLYKVGVKRRWWKGIRGGDVGLFVAALTLINVVYDRAAPGTPAAKDSAMSLVKVLRGEVEIGLTEKKSDGTQTEKED